MKLHFSDEYSVPIPLSASLLRASNVRCGSGIVLAQQFQFRCAGMRSIKMKGRKIKIRIRLTQENSKCCMA